MRKEASWTHTKRRNAEMPTPSRPSKAAALFPTPPMHLLILLHASKQTPSRNLLGVFVSSLFPSFQSSSRPTAFHHLDDQQQHCHSQS
ncbi:uncharacterized protein SPSK_10600 [Sporothrix schenckii 1099-18]|uniref:Uncharacterized protein n=1 Tax=Sporothrix schenckii 1099-18 TaxID=1397361 RepID=A0A0F2M0M5_SPOSC|nr:uncharacterized protein SPSK_10600 [Sporothrix schenckii 1099-18]KJR83252.1 hypothetical protein SPSK_10600 [Sporothrix schenckii 1099-18]